MFSFPLLEPLFAPRLVPKGLQDLLELDNEGEDGGLAERFEFSLDFGKTSLRTYSEADAFLNRFVVFAQADGTGSFYAVWFDEERENVAECPIVVFGSEGGIQVVACNLAEWLQILSFDVETMASHDRVFYCKTDDHVPSDRSGEYKRWLVDSQRLSPIENADAIVKVASERHQESLTSFIRQHVEDF